MPNLKIFAKTVEQEAIDQVNELLKQEAFKDCKVRIMPDTHAGKGCVIGFTADLGDKVIANIVGVDIGCGMYCVNLGQIDIDLQELDNVIRKYVPNGKNVHEGRIYKYDDLQNLNCFRQLKDTKRIERSIGTLGGGNHFIEVDKDDDGNKYLIIHTGSRNFGLQVAKIYQDLAIELCSGKDIMYDEIENTIKEYKEQNRTQELQNIIKNIKDKYSKMLPDIPKDLCYLSGKYRDDYLHDMKICQEYAKLNRFHIAKLILDNMNITNIIDRFETIHNYIDMESNIVRKGAISAKEGELLLIPINMRDGCILGVGKGNEDWNYSAPHGAGRLMSRTKAKAVYSLEEFQNSMEGIFTTSVSTDTIDEAPMVYKDMQEIIDGIQDTVEIKKILKPIYNFKASE